MDQETDNIKRHIDTERKQLGQNFQEIEHRLKEATDLRSHFNNNTGLVLGAAVASGFLLSRAFGKSAEPATTNRVPQPKSFPSAHLVKVSETLDDIFAGLIGVVSSKLESFVADAVPGFREQYRSTERRGSGPYVQRKPNVAESSTPVQGKF